MMSAFLKISITVAKKLLKAIKPYF